MSALIITKLKVANFETFKAAYDAGEPMRREFHARGVTVLRDATDPNLVTVLSRFDSVAAAKAMIGSERWKDATKSAGGAPMEVFFTEVADDKRY